uniref:Uncharacterized protein n=1 Tax=Globodera rostochiensis TaxID=31243 RepID=A0A914I987_GLORO
MDNLNDVICPPIPRALCLSYHLFCDEFPFLGHELKRQNLALGGAKVYKDCTTTYNHIFATFNVAAINALSALTTTILAGASVSSHPQQQQNKVLTTSGKL